MTQFSASDTQELRLALSNATDGDVIALKAGSYGAFTIASYNKNVTITSEDQTNQAMFDQILVTGSSNVTLDHLSFHGNPDTDGQFFQLVRVSGSDNITVQNSTFTGDRWQDASLPGSLPGYYGGYGIMSTNSTNTKILSNDVSGVRKGIQASGDDGILIEGNYIHDYREDGIFGGDISNSTINANIVIHNDIGHVLPNGLGDHPDLIQVVGANSVNITNNFLNQGAGTQTQGIWTTLSLNHANGFPDGHLNIEGNLVIAGMRNGIASFTPNSTITNNVLLQTDHDISWPPILRIGSTAVNSVVTDNVIQGISATLPTSVIASNNSILLRADYDSYFKDATADALSTLESFTPLGGSKIGGFDFQNLLTTLTKAGNVGFATVYSQPLPYSPINMDPSANDDAAQLDQDTSTTINVLANDTDPDGDTLTVSGITQAGNGSVVLNQNGTVTYTPDANFVGADSFTYSVSDGKGGVDTATVTLDVQAAATPVTAPALLSISQLSINSGTVFNVSTTSELTAALNKASGGDVINLAAGDYGNYTINGLKFSSDVTIQSADPNNQAVFNQIKVLNASNIEFKGIFLDFVPDQNTVKWTTAMDIRSSTGIAFRDGIIEGGPAIVGGNGAVVGMPVGYGGQAIGSQDIQFTGNDISGFYWGLRLPSDDVLVQGNHIHDTRSSPIGGGGNNFIVDGNYMHDVTPYNYGPAGDHGDFIKIVNLGSTPFNNIQLSNNIMYAGNGVQIMGIMTQGDMDNVIIENNVISTGHTSGMFLNALNGGRVNNNTVIDGDLTDNKHPGIIVTNRSTNIQIYDNVADRVQVSGNAGPGNTMANNFIVQHTNPSGAGYYSDVFANPLAGSSLDIFGLKGVPGSAIETSGLGANFTKLVGIASLPGVTGQHVPTPTPIPTPAPTPVPPVQVQPAPNADPTAFDDSAQLNQGTSVNIDVVANDTDPDGDTLYVDYVGTAQNGTVDIDVDGTILYTPDANFSGTDSFGYVVSDGNGGQDVAFVDVTVFASTAPAPAPVVTIPTPAPVPVVTIPTPAPVVPAPAAPVVNIPTPAQTIVAGTPAPIQIVPTPAAPAPATTNLIPIPGSIPTLAIDPDPIGASITSVSPTTSTTILPVADDVPALVDDAVILDVVAAPVAPDPVVATVVPAPISPLSGFSAVAQVEMDKFATGLSQIVAQELSFINEALVTKLLTTKSGASAVADSLREQIAEMHMADGLFTFGHVDSDSSSLQKLVAALDSADDASDHSQIAANINEAVNHTIAQTHTPAANDFA